MTQKQWISTQPSQDGAEGKVGRTETPDWLEKTAAFMADKQKNGPVFANDDDGNYCKFMPDGSKEILSTADDIEAENQERFGLTEQ